MAEDGPDRHKESWLRRFWNDLSRRRPEPHDWVVRIIIVERIAKAVILITLAVGVIVVGRRGLLVQWASEAQYQLTLDTGHSIFRRWFEELLVRIGFYRHVTAIALGAILYAGLEGTEGVGLALRRRWAEYLTVIATGLLIPYEAWEVAHRLTFIRVGALLVNVAVVGYLAYRKRLFRDL
jgi:uncharacterized membrane protein (DUF2068 family)